MAHEIHVSPLNSRGLRDSGYSLQSHLCSRYDDTGFGQISKELQRHYGEANPTQSLIVEYTYSDGDKGSRLESIIYPTVNGSAGRTVTYGYGAIGSLDDKIGRVVSLSDSVVNGPVETYAYLGLSTLVEARRPETKIHLILHNEYAYGDEAKRPDGSIDGGDQYTGLDRFGRVIDQMWVNLNPGAESFFADRFQYAYDAAGSPLYKHDRVNTDRSELYHADKEHASVAYDPLGRMGAFQRGALADAAQGTRINVIEGANGRADRGWRWHHDGQLDQVYAGRESATGQPTSNLNEVQGYYKTGEYVSLIPNELSRWIKRDGFGRLGSSWLEKRLPREVDQQGEEISPAHEQLRARVWYYYDALGRLIKAESVDDNDFVRQKTHFYHDGLKTINHREWNPGDGEYSLANVWGVAGMGLLILQDLVEGEAYGRTYVLQDAQHNVTAIVADPAGAGPTRRFVYDPVGMPTAFSLSGQIITGSPGFNHLYRGAYMRQDLFGQDRLYHFAGDGGAGYDPYTGAAPVHDPLQRQVTVDGGVDFLAVLSRAAGLQMVRASYDATIALSRGDYVGAYNTWRAADPATQMVQGAVDDYMAYREHGLSPLDSFALSAAQRLPGFSTVFELYQMDAGVSLGAQDLGRTLTDDDYLWGGVSVAFDVATLGFGAAKGGSLRTMLKAAGYELGASLAVDGALFSAMGGTSFSPGSMDYDVGYSFSNGMLASVGGRVVRAARRAVKTSARAGHRGLKYAGKVYKPTGVAFTRSGFPKFDSLFNARIPKALRGPNIADPTQYTAATRQLKRAIEKQPKLANLFSRRQLGAIMKDKPRIPGFTWHHHQNGTMLQLVLRRIHAKTPHIGGRALTGGRP